MMSRVFTPFGLFLIVLFILLPGRAASADGQSGCFRNSDCAATAFCRFEDGACSHINGKEQAAGSCQPVRAICTREYRPVCGCDGKSYGNRCMAFAARTSVAHAGACKESKGDK